MAVAISCSCKLLTNSDKQFDTRDESKIYHLRLNPLKGGRYRYDMINQSAFKMEVGENKINNINKTSVGFSFDIDTDSTAGFLFTMKYDSIHLYTKNGDTETDLDAANAGLTVNPVEKMLGLLKTAHITAHINAAGGVEKVSGYNEMTDKIMAGFAASDNYTRAAAEAQWKKFIENGVIQKGMDQVFKLFPDSAVHVGDKWKLASSQNEELGISVKSVFTLKEINDGIAVLSSRGVITSDSTAVQLMGQNVNADLTGEEIGDYELDTGSGMLLKSRISSKVTGIIQMMGKEIPVSIETSVKVDGRKLN